jgi:hypothetical protein
VRDFWQNQPVAPDYFGYRHSMLRDAWWNLHLRFHPRDARAEARLPPDVLGDPWLTWLEHTWPLHTLALTLLLFVIGGADAVAVCVALRVAAGILGHWAVGYVAHRWGERRHVIEGAAEGGTNVWLLGVLSFGEGFHNNHHAHPTSPRMGERWFEFDVGWYALSVLATLRLVRLKARISPPAPKRSPMVSGAAGSKVSSVGEFQWKRPLRRGLKVTFSVPSTTGWLKESVSAQSGRSQLGTVKVRCCGSGGAAGTCGVEASGTGGGVGASTRVAAPASGATVGVVQASETTVASKTMPTRRG